MLTTRFRRTPRRRRRGAVVVESALVLSVFLMLLFGMFEYCRFLLVLQVTNNAARSGARYAVVNTDKPSTFNTTNYTDGAGNTYLSIYNYTLTQLAGVQQNFQVPTKVLVAVYAVDPTGLTLTPPVIRPKSTSTTVYPDPSNPSDPNAGYGVPWNQAAFTEKIAVSVYGTYQPFLPTLLLMPTSIPIAITSLAGAE